MKSEEMGLTAKRIGTRMTLIGLMDTDKAGIALSFRHIVRNPSDYSAMIKQILTFSQNDRDD